MHHHTFFAYGFFCSLQIGAVVAVRRPNEPSRVSDCVANRRPRELCPAPMESVDIPLSNRLIDSLHDQVSIVNVFQSIIWDGCAELELYKLLYVIMTEKLPCT